MEPKKKIRRFEGLEFKKDYYAHERRYRMGGSLTPHMVMTPSGVERPTHRYLMEIPTPNGIVECWVNCEKPGYNARHERMNYMYETHVLLGENVVASRYEWNPIRVIIRDLIGEDSTMGEVGNFLMSWFQAYSNGQYARTFKRNVTIQMIDPTGVVVESWHLQGAFPTVVTFNDLSFDHTETELEFTLNYDRAIFNV
jgi:hypothetical protein